MSYRMLRLGHRVTATDRASLAKTLGGLAWREVAKTFDQLLLTSLNTFQTSIQEKVRQSESQCYSAPSQMRCAARNRGLREEVFIKPSVP